MVGDGGLDQVPGAIQFVFIAQVGPALSTSIVREVGVEVTVGLLRIGDLGDHSAGHLRQGFVLRLGPKGGIGAGGERPRGRFEPFVDVGVVVVSALEGDVQLARRAAEVINPAGLLEEAILRGKRDLPIDPPARRPEVVGECDGSQRDRPQASVRAP